MAYRWQKWDYLVIDDSSTNQIQTWTTIRVHFICKPIFCIFSEFGIPMENPAKFGTDWSKCFSKLGIYEPPNYDREMTCRVVWWLWSDLVEYFTRFEGIKSLFSGHWYRPVNICHRIHFNKFLIRFGPREIFSQKRRDMI